MIIKNLVAKNYRNIENEKIEFQDGVNLLLGGNAQGKTNVIEAIYTFARGKSFRPANDRRLVRFGSEGYLIELTFEDRRREQRLSYEFVGNERIKKKNGIKEAKASDMIGVFRAVLFHPEHLSIVKGGPSERREFLNIAISQSDGIYIKNCASYNKLLENRNVLLKNAQKSRYINPDEILAFSEHLSHFSAAIYMARREYIKRLEHHAARILLEISDGKEELSLEYKADIIAESESEAKEEYGKIYSAEIEREIQNGVSLFGIHHDDIEIKINDKPARLFASQGQQRSVALALKMAEGEVSCEINGEYPVFLFDDVLSELDNKRQRYVLSKIVGKQIIVSACDETLFREGEVNIITVKEGHYVSSHR